MGKNIRIMFALFSLTFLFSCEQNHFHEGKFFAGGVHATAKQLNSGKSTYEEYCMACHGMDGKGKGVAYKGMSNPPRNFHQGLYKFGDVVAGGLPHDEGLKNIIQKGLDGTAMLPWDISDQQTHNVIQYIKTFALKEWEGKDKKLGEKIAMTKDPYGIAHKKGAIERGSEVYHIIGDCQSCHRAYVTKQELSALSVKVNDEELDLDEIDEDIYDLKPQDSEFGHKVLPPDFTWHSVKSAKTVPELFLRISAGVNGTGMPSWKGTLEENDIWAVSHYIKSLMDLKDTPEREKLIGRLK